MTLTKLTGDSKVGELNGRWAFLFKGALALLPLGFTAIVYLVGSSMTIRERLVRIETNQESSNSTMGLIEKNHNRIDDNMVSIASVRERVMVIESAFDEIKNRLDRIEGFVRDDKKKP